MPHGARRAVHAVRRGLAVVALVGSGLVAFEVAAVAATGAAGPAGLPPSGAICGAPSRGHAECLAEVVRRATFGSLHRAGALSTTAPHGFSPHAIETAYGFPTGGGSGETIAIVDAYGDPTIGVDLSTFSSTYGLAACTTTSGCLHVVNGSGGSTLPFSTSGWDIEQSLDVEWAHALAPGAKILLVEADSNSWTSLLGAVRYAAATAGAGYVSMSWGGNDTAIETTFDSTFSASPGTSFFAAAGDSASAVVYPSASPDVVSVGGTTLTVTTGTGAWKSESAWDTAGGGCSSYETAAAAQTHWRTYPQAGCSGKRATPDVSLDANPSSGVAIYDTVPLGTGASGWLEVGGTSASTAMLAGRAAASGLHVDAATVYDDQFKIDNVTSGSNGHSCMKGYNLCTGLGSWNTSAGVFLPRGALGLSAPARVATGEVATATVSLSAAQLTPTRVEVTGSKGATFATGSAGPFTSSLSFTVPAGATRATFSVKNAGWTAISVAVTAAGFTKAEATIGVPLRAPRIVIPPAAPPGA